MKASELKHVAIAHAFFDQFFHGCYQHLNLTFNGNAKKNSSNRGVCISAEIEDASNLPPWPAGNSQPDTNILNSPKATSVMKLFLEKQYKDNQLAESIPYFNMDWSFCVNESSVQGETGQNKQVEHLSISVDFKLA